MVFDSYDEFTQWLSDSSDIGAPYNNGWFVSETPVSFAHAVDARLFSRRWILREAYPSGSLMYVSVDFQKKINGQTIYA